MSAPFDHERWEELAVAHALDALEPSEEAGFLVHLADCARCRAVVDDVAAAAADLALTVDQTAPPARLRESLLHEVARTAQLPQPAPRPALPRERADVIVPAARRATSLQRWSAPPVQWMVAAAAGVALLLGLGTVARLSDSPPTKQDAVAAAFIACSKDPQCKEIRLTAEKSQVVATVLVRGGHAEIVTDGLAPNSASSTTYVLWAQHFRGAAKSVGVFDVPAGGPSVHELEDLPWSLSDTVAFMVTREAGNTAPKSGSTPLAKGTVSS